MRARTLAYDNRLLMSLRALRERTSDAWAVARIVSSSASSTRLFGLLNAGRRQGVHEGQPVRGPEGLIGRVLEAGPDVARILLITDPDSVVPVRRTRDGLPAIATGRGDGLVEVKPENGRASCRERVCQYVWISVGGVSLKKQITVYT